MSVSDIFRCEPSLGFPSPEVSERPGLQALHSRGICTCPFPSRGLHRAGASFIPVVGLDFLHGAGSPIRNALRAGRSARAISMGTVFPPKAPAPLENEQI